MNKVLLLIAVGVAALTVTSYAQLTTVWQRSKATSNLPGWFGTSDNQRGLAYGKVGGNDRVYVVNKSIPNVVILDAATGDSVGTLNTTGITGGTFPLDDIEVSSDGVIFAANLTVNAQSSPFKVYKWTGEGGTPVAVISYADSAYRLGDHFTVTGSTTDNSIVIWAAANGKKAVVKFTTMDNGATFKATVIALNDTVNTGPTPKVWPLPNGNFFISSAGVGIREYDASGNLVGAVTSMPITMGSMAYIAGGSPMKAYVFGYNYTSSQVNNPPQFVQIVDVTNGIDKGDSVGTTPVLGTTLNANGTGDIALKDNGNGTVTIFVLATNNGLGAFTFTGWSMAQTVTTVWQRSKATSNLPGWFGTSDNQRGLAYGKVGGNDRVYVVNKSIPNVVILDAATGDSVGTLNTTGITGGTFPLDDIEVSSDGVIFAANLTVNAQSSPFKVYKWTGEGGTPVAVISYADSAYRLGDHFTVTGSTTDNSIVIWAAANGKKAVVKFTTMDNGATFKATVIALNDTVNTGPTPKVWPLPNGNFFISSAGVGIREYDASGNLVGAVTSMPITMGSMAYIAGGSPMKAYVFGYNYTSSQVNNPPQFVQIVDVTNGIDKGDSVGTTPVLGTTLNANGTGDIALKDNGNGTVTIFVLATNNGLGAFTFDAKLTAVREHLAGENPMSYSLTQNYPNPFNPTTVISYSIPRNSFVSLKIYNVLGQEIETLFEGEQKAGTYTVTFDGSRLASGIYLYRLQSGSLSITRKMMLVK